MELMQNEDGSWSECYMVPVYFRKELERNAFCAWLQGKGSDAFAAWFEGKEKLRGTDCETCKWCDPTQAQCYDGHIQGVGPCRRWEFEP